MQPYSPLGGTAHSGGCPLGPLVSLKALALVFLPSFLSFVALDFVWIAFVAKDLYAPLKPVLKPSPDPAAAVLSWLCIVAANYAFVLPRTGGGKRAWHIIGQGALFGFLTYGMVDLTNAALIESWSWQIAAVDMTWGALASSVLAVTQRTLCGLFPAAGLV